ncbi:MAG: glutamine--tRNA ligase, partial [Bacteroidales bacterium]
ESIRLFAEKVGVAKRDNTIDLSLLEWCVREDLNKRANRYMAVLDPVKLVITNWEEGKVEEFQAPLNPANPDGAKRTIKFAKELYIERDDFMEEPPKKYFRLKPGGEVRLKYTYIIKCEEVIKDAAGTITEIRCTYDPTSKPGEGEWRSVKGTIHWVAVNEAKKVEIRLIDRLFTEPFMDAIPEGADYKDYLNPDSLKVIDGYTEPALLEDPFGIAVQFERLGYFVKDADSTADKLVFNKTTGLKDTFKM